MMISELKDIRIKVDANEILSDSSATQCIRDYKNTNTKLRGVLPHL